MAINPKLDLELVREIDVPIELVWKAWTDPQHLMKWFTPKPWETVACELDLRPGGRFFTVMRSPEGQDYPGEGCYLAVESPTRLIWTNALLPGYRPNPQKSGEHCGDFHFTAELILERLPQGTRYIARVFHADEEGRKRHEDMGFHDGWGAALDQLVAWAKSQ
ncbi:SRPBCC family protein [Chitinimonas sp. BJYL2]|uniref:SRPBCC family protein n=1 Tax=Chitinimonas sp. BJYL2 TaxID=2976696 RepID=UPI0022B37B81|nr:SRPBCC family protein [Chitinimonas sp. BJYL2]